MHPYLLRMMGGMEHILSTSQYVSWKCSVLEAMKITTFALPSCCPARPLPVPVLQEFQLGGPSPLNWPVSNTSLLATRASVYLPLPLFKNVRNKRVNCVMWGTILLVAIIPKCFSFIRREQPRRCHSLIASGWPVVVQGYSPPTSLDVNDFVSIGQTHASQRNNARIHDRAKTATRENICVLAKGHRVFCFDHQRRGRNLGV